LEAGAAAEPTARPADRGTEAWVQVDRSARVVARPLSGRESSEHPWYRYRHRYPHQYRYPDRCRYQEEEREVGYQEVGYQEEDREEGQQEGEAMLASQHGR